LVIKTRRIEIIIEKQQPRLLQNPERVTLSPHVLTTKLFLFFILRGKGLLCGEKKSSDFRKITNFAAKY
jgi:hypothetical protein